MHIFCMLGNPVLCFFLYAWKAYILVRSPGVASHGSCKDLGKIQVHCFELCVSECCRSVSSSQIEGE